MRITKKDLKKFILEELAAKTQKPLDFIERTEQYLKSARPNEDTQRLQNAFHAAMMSTVDMDWNLRTDEDEQKFNDYVESQTMTRFHETDPNFVGPPSTLQEMEAWYTPEEKKRLQQMKQAREIERIESDPEFVGPPQSAKGSFSKVPVWNKDELSDAEQIAALLQRSVDALTPAEEMLYFKPRWWHKLMADNPVELGPSKQVPPITDTIEISDEDALSLLSTLKNIPNLDLPAFQVDDLDTGVDLEAGAAAPPAPMPTPPPATTADVGLPDIGDIEVAAAPEVRAPETPLPPSPAPGVTATMAANREDDVDDILKYIMREATNYIKQPKQRTKQMKITKQEIIDLISEELKSVVQEDKYSRPTASEYPGGKLGTAKVPALKRTEPETYVGGPQVGQAVTPPVQVAEPESKPVSKRDDKEFPDLTGDGEVTQADVLKGRGVKLAEDNELEEAEGIFAPNHYCVHHGGVSHNGSVQMAEAVNHDYDEELGRVTHYDMKLEDGTVLENVPFEEIQVTEASLAKEHQHSVMKRDKKDEENLEEESELNENLLESKKASAVSWSDVRDSFSKLLK